MMNSWYVLNSKPSKEDTLYHHAQSSGYEVFYPRVYVRSTNPNTRKFRPFFPGYMFVNVDLSRSGISTFQWMPFANGLVSFGGEPAAVPDPLVQAIRQKIAELTQVGQNLVSHLKRGDRVTIQEGPLAGYQAIFDGALDGRDRVRILLQQISGQTIPVVMNAGAIELTKQTEISAR